MIAPVARRPGVRARGRDLAWRPALHCGFVAFDEYYGENQLQRGEAYTNFKFRCSLHGNCVKTKGVNATSTRTWGPLEPLAFLHAWRSTAVPADGRLTHARVNPSREAVAAVIREHRAALEELHRALVPGAP